MKQRTLMLALVAMFALALAAPLTASAATTVGTITSRSGSSFSLGNGEVVFMHPGTVINPEGSDLEPGMTVTVIGRYNGDGTLNADEINLGTPRSYNAPAYGPPAYQRGWYDMNGNFHAVAPRGYYDQFGNWHPAY